MNFATYTILLLLGIFNVGLLAYIAGCVTRLEKKIK
jgi:hypothetical protein